MKKIIYKKIRKPLSIVVCIAIVLITCPMSGLRQSSFTAYKDQPGRNWLDEGNYDTSWYDKDPKAEKFYIGTARELAGFAHLINNGKETFEGKEIILTSDIDLSGKFWTPAGFEYEGENMPEPVPSVRPAPSVKPVPSVRPAPSVKPDPSIKPVPTGEPDPLPDPPTQPKPDNTDGQPEPTPIEIPYDPNTEAPPDPPPGDGPYSPFNYNYARLPAQAEPQPTAQTQNQPAPAPSQPQPITQSDPAPAQQPPQPGRVFHGTFDGDFHKITGLKIGTPNVPEKFHKHAGLFGLTGRNITIKNVHVEVEIYVGEVDEGKVGSIAGETSGNIINCGATGKITAHTMYLGGLIGYGTRIGIANSYSSVDVTGYIYMGGIAGYISTGTIFNSYSAGEINANLAVQHAKYNEKQYIGAALGMSQSCYHVNLFWNDKVNPEAFGETSGTSMRYNSVGLPPEVMLGNEAPKYLLYYMTLQELKPIMTKGAFLEILSRSTDIGFEDIFSEEEKTFNLCNWKEDNKEKPINKGYPVHMLTPGKIECTLEKGTAVRSVVVTGKIPQGNKWGYKLSSDRIRLEKGTRLTDYTSYTPGSEIANVRQGHYLSIFELDQDDRVVAFKDFELKASDFRVEYDLRGSGTAEDPCVIETLEDLENFARRVEDGFNYEGCIIELKNDLDFSGYTGWRSIGYTSENDFSFAGTFDGKGHTIRNFNNASEECQGLFYESYGTVKNLNISVDVHSDSEQHKKTDYLGFAGLVTYNFGTIENCRVSGSIKVSNPFSWTGGITTINYGEIINCHSTVNITVDANR